MEKISDNQSNLTPKESKFFLEDWNSAQKKSYLTKEMKKLFESNFDKCEPFSYDFEVIDASEFL